MPSYEHFSGQLSAIPQVASPGLQFLKEYLPLLDSEKPVILDNHVKPSATLITNGSQPIPMKELPQMFEKRAEMLSIFTHTAHPIEAWDMERLMGERTVIFHSVSRSVFRADGKMVEVNELNILDLEPAPEGSGASGLWVSSSKVYMDISGFQK